MTTYNPLTWPYPVPAGDVVLSVTYDGNPLAKERPRFGRGKVYTTDKTRAYEDAIGWMIRDVLRWNEPDSHSRFALRCMFYRKTAHRIDCDNMEKAILDAANGLVWKDDSQVTEQISKVFFKSKRPRVEIVIHRIEAVTNGN